MEDPGQAIAGWLATTMGTPIVQTEPTTSVGDGFDNRIYFVRFDGPGLSEAWRQPLVARVASTPDRFVLASHEAAVQTWCVERGFPVPAVLAVIPPGEALDVVIQVMQRAPGETAADAMAKSPQRIPDLMSRMAALNARLHDTSPDGWPQLPRVPGSLLDRRLWLVKRVVENVGDPDISWGLDAVQRLRSRLEDAPPVPCHGDFHPLNVLVDRDDITVLDWTDAGLGDRHGDVARTLLLFRVAAIGATKRSERVVVRAATPWLRRLYRKAYLRHAPLDDSRLLLWEPAHLLHAWAGVVAQRSDVAELKATRPFPPRLGTWLETEFRSSIARVA